MSRHADKSRSRPRVGQVTTHFSVRIGNIDDAPAVSALLKASYTEQLSASYSPDVLARALPLMTRANPRLLNSGTYYVAHTETQLVGCGGWSMEAPGSNLIQEGNAHIRHVGTHPDWLRHGIARALLLRCFRDAATAGLTTLECHSTLGAVSFYVAMGFSVVGSMEMQLAPEIAIDGVLLRRELPDASAERNSKG
jgi:N-acetylglutamate synthase-like GNAT family acetyltransferase